MKPILLTMRAFGSFADQQTVDFSALGAGGLYLITGETGAGKTTIFDAVSFALYGQASGVGRRDYMTLTSDFADEKTTTSVSLTFVSGGAQYEIRRLIRRRGQEVLLTLPDGDCLSGRRNVEAKIAEIVGLDRDQFGQIVMIAQNDFLRFLQSGTDERLKILRRIFGTEPLRQLQDRLRERAKEAREKQERFLHDFARHNVDVHQRENLFSQWEIRIREDQRRLKEVEKALSLLDESKMALTARLAVAETSARNFSHLAEYRQALEAYEAQKDARTDDRRRADRGEIALRRVKPVADEAIRAAQEHAVAVTAMKEADAKTAEALREKGAADAQAEALPSLEETRSAFSSLSRAWEDACEQLELLNQLVKNRGAIEERQSVLHDLRARLSDAKQRLLQLPRVSDRETALQRLTAERDEAEARRERLGALHAECRAIQDRQGDLMKAQTAFESIHAGFVDADGRYQALEENYLRNQAGILAAGLSEGAPCPVCGSAVHPDPAVVSGKEVTGASLKKARDAREKAAAQREEQSALCGALKTEIDTLGRRFLTDLSAVKPGGDRDGFDGGDRDGLGGGDRDGLIGGDRDGFGGGDRDGLGGGDRDGFDGGDRDGFDGGDRDGLVGGNRDGFGGGDRDGDWSATVLDEAEIRLTREENEAALTVAALAKSVILAEQALSEIRDESDRATECVSDLTPKIAGLQSEIDTLIQRYLLDLRVCLPEADWESSATVATDLFARAEEKAARLATEKEAGAENLARLTESWDQAIRRKQDAESALKAAETLVSERTAAARKHQERQEETAAKFKYALTDCGFDDGPTYEAALMTDEDLATLKKRTEDYAKAGEQLIRDIRRLEAETAGETPPNLDALRSELKTVTDTSSETQETRDEVRSRLNEMTQALKELRQAAAGFEEAEKSHAAVKQLADTANGRLDFETYAQTAYFERALHAANLRLKRMSQNRYTLLRREEDGDKRSRTGLEIEVLDAYTGKARSANSLSGGESFMASLSLALGLSDVVQQSAGGVSLDAMFIDEGFGSLDAEVLDFAVRTLTEMAGQNRTIGIISHVAELSERIDRQIRVEKTPQGSKIHVVV